MKLQPRGKFVKPRINLGSRLYHRYERTGNQQDLEASIAHAQAA